MSCRPIIDVRKFPTNSPPAIDERKFQTNSQSSISHIEETNKIDVLPFAMEIDEDGLMDLLMEHEANESTQDIESENEYEEINEGSIYDRLRSQTDQYQCNQWDDEISTHVIEQ